MNEKDLPDVATNYEDINSFDIHTYIENIMNNENIDTLIFVAPYVSSFFVKMLKNSNIKLIMGIFNNRVPKYTRKAIEELQQLNNNGMRVELRKRKKDSNFLHMKVMIPYYINRSTSKLYPKCAFSGSVNWTKGGLEKNDELLIVLNDHKSIDTCVKILDRLWISSIPIKLI